MLWYWTMLFQAFASATQVAFFVTDTTRWWAAGFAVVCFILALHAIAMDARA